jgi:PKD repeat protein
MKKKNMLITAMIASSLFLIAALPVSAVDVTITDPTGDVSLIDIYGEKSTYVTSSPDINVDNIDITRLTFTKTGGSATCTLEVKGTIEDRGNILDASGGYPENLTEINDIEYVTTLYTKLAGSSAETYSITYVNKKCQYQTTSSVNPINLTSPHDFSVAGNTLTVTIPLVNTDEVYDHMISNTTFMKVNLSALSSNQTNPEDFSKYYTILQDEAPNPPLAVSILYAPNVGSVGESLQFNSTVLPLTGQPPFTYGWKFGDGGTSSAQNPTHTYTKSGTYTYNLTVSDYANTKAYQTGDIQVTSEGGGSVGSSPLLLFLAVIIVIAAIGVVVLVVIIRRR